MHNCVVLDHSWIAPSTADLINVSSDIFISAVAVEYEAAEGGLGLPKQDLRRETRYWGSVNVGILFTEKTHFTRNDIRLLSR